MKNHLKELYKKMLSPITNRQAESIEILNRICEELQQMRFVWNQVAVRVLSLGLSNLNEVSENTIEICREDTIENCAKNDKLCITVPRVLGKKFFWVSHASATDNVSEQAHKGALWLPQELLCFAEKGSGCFLDLGANIGGVCLALAACGWKGFAVEASEINCNLLKKSIMLNDMDITLCEMGVWKYTGQIYFLQDGPWGTILEHAKNYDNVIKINAFRLDDYEKTVLCSIQSLDLIKMDIEGSEVAALEGMGNFLHKMNYPCIFAEANALTLSVIADNTVGDMVRKCAQYGYEAYRYMDGVWRKFDESFFIDCICTDYMFIHKDKIKEFPSEIGEPCLRPDDIQTVESILNVLNQFIASPLNKDPLEFAVAVLATLCDFPQFVQNARVMGLLYKINMCTDLPEVIKKPLKKLFKLYTIVQA